MFPHCSLNDLIFFFMFLLFSCIRLFCNPMDCNMPGLPVLHHLSELAQDHVHWAGDGIQPSHSLSSPSPAFYFSQHQGLFQWVSSSHQVAKVLQFHGNKGADNIQEYIWQHEIIYRKTGKIPKLLRNTKVLQQKKKRRKVMIVDWNISV